MKSLLAALVLLLAAASLYAQTAPPRYAVLNTENGEPFLTALNQFADRGYRVVAASKYTILRLEAAPPDTYRYLRLEVKGGPAQFTNWVNQQGAHGYSWLPRTRLLEKAPHPRNYEYTYPTHGTFAPTKSNNLSSLVEAGYRPVDRVFFSHALGSSTSEIFFERDLDQPAAPAARYPGTTVAVADAMRADNVMKQVDDLARKGYRYLGPHDSAKGGGNAVMMAKCSEDCVGRYEYRYFDAKDAAQVERDLNALGKDGFQVVPAGLRSRPHVLERDTHLKKAFAYRVLDPLDALSLERLVNAADAEGYVPVDFVWHAGWTAQGFLVLEKESTVSRAPEPRSPSAHRPRTPGSAPRRES